MTIIDISPIYSSQKIDPCMSCIIGWTSIAQWQDPETGDLMQERKNCYDVCERLKEAYNESRISTRQGDTRS